MLMLVINRCVYVEMKCKMIQSIPQTRHQLGTGRHSPSLGINTHANI